ncbi:MAG TPA: GTPase [Sedimentisphaerales bacterium]|nr:GTPase [Sedimentisphaerales bacterium]
MAAFAAVMTGKGTGAISTIQVFGDKAEAVIKNIFKSIGTKPPILQPGKILLGTIVDGSETIDRVAIGCEGPETFAINCHGNPLIVEMIMQLLQQHGAKLLTADELRAKTLLAQKLPSTIVLEARLTQPKAKTLEGTKIIANQIEDGLSKKAAEWLKNIDAISIDQIKAELDQIFTNSQTAKLIITGCKAAIIGPPNTGKSTLLNCLAGRRKAIVTDIKGTTRDWVSARCKIGPLSIELIDTAGLDEELAATPQDRIKKASQQKSVEILENADLVLLVLDNSQSTDQLGERLLDKIAGKKVLTVLNKSDLPARLDIGKVPKILANTVQISAKFETGIENLTEKIQQLAGVADFDLHTTVCFTSRQENLLKQLKNVKSKQHAASIITELLNGQLRV